MPEQSPEPNNSLNLSDLRLMPKWVADFGKAQPLPKHYDEPGEDRPRDGSRPRGRFGDRGGFNNRGDRPPPRGDRPPPPGGRARHDDRGRGRDQGPRDDRRRGDDRFDRRSDHRGPRPEPPPTLPGLAAAVEPDARAIEAMSHMIRAAGKAYSVFEAAKLVLASGDRFHVIFTREGGADVKFITVPADGSAWVSREEALNHLLNNEELLVQHYRAETIELEEPKGVFASVAICGMSGELLGPPSHHSYQTSLHRIHRERFAHMPFEDYKRRVRTDPSPEAVQKWKDSQKQGTEWVDLKAQVPEGGEAPRFKKRSDMENHFRTHYAQALLGETSRATVRGDIPKENLSPVLYFALRRAVDDARKNLLPTAQQICSGFEKNSLKLFKRRGGKLWVGRARPRLLDSSVVLSDRIARMVGIIKGHNGMPVKDLLDSVAPPPPEHVANPDPGTGQAAAEPSAPVEDQAPPSSANHDASPERLQALNDLHWLNSEGYVIEYFDGIVCIGVTEPPPAKPKPVREPAAPAAEAPAPAVAPATEEPGEEHDVPAPDFLVEEPLHPEALAGEPTAPAE